MASTTDSDAPLEDYEVLDEGAATTTIVIAVMADATIPGRVRNRLTEEDAEFVAVPKHPGAVVGRFEVTSPDDPVIDDLLGMAIELWHDPDVGGPAVVADPRLAVTIAPTGDTDHNPVDEAVALCLDAWPGEVLISKELVGRPGSTTDTVYREHDGSILTLDRLVTVGEHRSAGADFSAPMPVQSISSLPVYTFGDEPAEEPSSTMPDEPIKDFDGSALRQLQELTETVGGDSVAARAMKDQAEPASTESDSMEPPPPLPPAQKRESDRAERLDAVRAEVVSAMSTTIEDGTTSMVVITGNARSGRTTMAMSVLEEVPQSVGTIIRIACGDEGHRAIWPVAQIVEQALDIGPTEPAEQVQEKIDRFFLGTDEGEVTAHWVAGILGLDGAVSNGERVGWTLRRVLATLGRQGPIVLAIDGVDHASEDFWFLLFEIAERIRDTTLFIVCTAKGAPMPILDANNVTSVECPPATLDDVAAEIQQVVDDEGLTDPILEGLAELANGDIGLVPSLVEVVPRLVGDPSRVAIMMPVSMAAVIEDEIQGLPEAERTIVGYAALIGRSFTTDLLRDIVPDGVAADVDDLLSALTDRGYLAADFEGRPDAFRFADGTVCEAAADTLSDDDRASAQERCGTWQQEHDGGRVVRFAEEVGMRFAAAQDLRNRVSGQMTSHGEIGDRAADMLALAANRAIDLGDSLSAIRLSGAASSVLSQGDGRRSENLLRSAVALARRNDPGAASAAQQAIASARSSGATAVEQRAKVLDARLSVAGSNSFEDLEGARAIADQAITILEGLGDDLGCAEAYLLRAAIAAARGNFGGCAEASARAAEHAHRAPSWADEVIALTTLAAAVAEGPLPIPEAVLGCTDAAHRLRDDMNSRQEVEGRLAVLLARQGRIEEARQATARVAATFEEIGNPDTIAIGYCRAGQVEMLSGDHEVAIQHLRAALGSAVSLSVTGSVAAVLAHALLFDDEFEEALALTERAETDVRAGDLITPVLWRMARAKALAALGRHNDADIIGRHGLRLAEQTDSAILRAEALLDLARTISEERQSEAIPLAAKAQRIFERKGAYAQATEAKEWFEATKVTPGAPVVAEAEAAPEATAGRVRNPDAYEI